MHQIETHADQLSEQVIQAVRTSPRTRSMNELSEAELKSRVFDLFRHFGRWISEKNEDEIEGTYGELGQRRCREGMPLNELIYALILVKQHVWDHVLKNVMPVSEGRLYEEELLGEMLGKFFDRALYHTVRGYEEAWIKEALSVCSPARSRPHGAHHRHRESDSRRAGRGGTCSTTMAVCAR
jgi:hypothetical protein